MKNLVREKIVKELDKRIKGFCIANWHDNILIITIFCNNQSFRIQCNDVLDDILNNITIDKIVSDILATYKKNLLKIYFKK